MSTVRPINQMSLLTDIFVYLERLRIAAEELRDSLVEDKEDQALLSPSTFARSAAGSHPKQKLSARSAPKTRGWPRPVILSPSRRRAG
jgi:hypothetical protein